LFPPLFPERIVARPRREEEPTMGRYKVFTWNMQRAQSISGTDAVAKERLRVLKELLEWADFGFITEPGKDIRDNLDGYSLPGLGGKNFLASPWSDNQSDASACRPVVYSKTPFLDIPTNNEKYINFLSGGEEAYRYPAAGIVTLPGGDGQGNTNLLLLSYHATSGYNARENCQKYFDTFYDSPGGKAKPLLWIVGGDFNCNAGRGVYQPTTNTHQSGHVLDGFFADQNGTNFMVTAPLEAGTCFLGGRLIYDTAAALHGYVVNGHHLSDHCPVVAELQIERGSEEPDPALILTGKRKRTPTKKDENYDYDVVDEDKPSKPPKRSRPDDPDRMDES
jgi:hypothetical protein